MYRIRSASGTEAVYNSLEEFHAAVRRGDVGPEDEIFHTRANRWLDVKSHPHYRVAVGWGGGDPFASAPPPQSPPSRPVGGPIAPTRPLESRPPGPPRSDPLRPASPETQLRPQLQADPVPGRTATPRVSPPPPPPRKSRELAFIDLGEPQPPRTNGVTTTPTEKPAPTPPGAGASPVGDAFLVMDTGLESPVRNSAGHRTVSDDLDLLFDSPLHQAPRPTTGPVPSVPPAAPRPPAPRPAEVSRPEPKAEAPPAIPSPSPARPSAPHTPVSASAHAAVEPAPPVPTPAPRARHSAGERAVTTVPAELEIPGLPLLMVDAVPAVAAPAPMPARVGRSSGLAYGAGALVLALGMTIALWRPWSRAGARDDGLAPTAAEGANPAGAAGLTGLAAALPGGQPPAVGGPTDSSLPPRPDSVIEPARETVLAASTPDFQASVDVGSAGIAFDTDLPATPAARAAASPSELARRLVQAERQAQQELGARLGVFRALLSPERIGTAEGAGRARAAWLAGAEAIRQYRARIARLEQSYEDSVLTAQRLQRWPAEELRLWTARQGLAEPAEVAQLAELMISQVSEGLELLAASDGKYEVKGDRITFSNATSVPRYLSIRAWVEQRTSEWRATPENARPYTLNAMLRALGDGFPAVQ